MKIRCYVCSKPINASPSRLRNRTITCSRICMGKARKSEGFLGVCSNCGVSFRTKQSHFLKKKSPACSKECGVAVKSKIMSGIGNHQFGLKGELNSSYVGDIRLSSFGYVQVRSLLHPFRDVDDWCFYHRLVIEEHLRKEGCVDYLAPVDGYPDLYLSKNFIVHHKDENKLNNKIDNLEVMTLSQHTRLHQKDLCLHRSPESGQYVPGKKLPSGKLYKKSPLDAGLDIYSSEDAIIPSYGALLISTELFLEIPPDSVGLVWSRSGMAVNNGIEVGAGCIDSNYRGEVKVLLRNLSQTDFTVRKGDRIAQLLTIQINTKDYKEIKDLTPSDRSSRGFGSTGD